MANAIVREFTLKDGTIDKDRAHAYFVAKFDKFLALLRQDFSGGATFTNRERMQMYTLVYNMVFTQRLAGHDDHVASWLQKMHTTLLHKYMREFAQPRWNTSLTDIALLRMVHTQYSQFELANRWLTALFGSIDNDSDRSLATKGRCLFRDMFFRTQCEAIGTAFADAFRRHRRGEVVDTSVLKSCVDLYISMEPDGLTEYTQYLETTVLRELADEERAQMRTRLETESVPVYVQNVQAEIDAELQWCRTVMHAQTVQKVCDQLHKIFVREAWQDIANAPTGPTRMLHQGQWRDVSRLVVLLTHADMAAELTPVVESFVKARGVEIVEARAQRIADDPKREKSTDAPYVRQLIEFVQTWEARLRDVFLHDHDIQKGLHCALHAVINRRSEHGKHQHTELLAAHCDQILRGMLRLSEDDARCELEGAELALRYLDDKDMFHDVYRTLMARRLLQDKVANRDLETDMISRLKLQYGTQFTTKLEGMWRDFDTDRYSDTTFAPGTTEATCACACTVKVLTKGWWPTFVDVPLTLPPLLKRLQDSFESYYYRRAHNKRLTWLHAEGRAVLRGRTPTNRKSFEVTVRTVQAAVILLLDGGDDPASWCSFSWIRQQTGLSVEVLKRVLHSVACNASHDVVTKSPKGNRVSPDHQFRLNRAFAPKLRSFTLPMASLENTYDKDKVQMDRKAAINAAIVRIMKTRQTVTHKELVHQVLHQLHFFSPDPRIVKRCIEDCISKDYMERSQDDAATYHYVA